MILGPVAADKLKERVESGQFKLPHESTISRARLKMDASLALLRTTMSSRILNPRSFILALIRRSFCKDDVAVQQICLVYPILLVDDGSINQSASWSAISGSLRSC